MKKRKTKISGTLIKSEAAIAKEVEERMASDEASRFSDPTCRDLTPCILCFLTEGDTIRKQFLPYGGVQRIKNGGTSTAIVLCARCLCKLIEKDKVKQIVCMSELR